MLSGRLRSRLLKTECQLFYKARRPTTCFAAGRSVFLIAAALLLLAGMTIPTKRLIWDGGYMDAEFELTFHDQDGNALEGVELRVEYPGGEKCFYYPVTDYLADATPRSGADGKIVFHHVSFQACETSGRVYEYFWMYQVMEEGPKFNCRFLYHDREIYRIDFG